MVDPGPSQPPRDGAAESALAPSVSIVIPAFNSARFLPATLRSIQQQSVSDWECVIVDDGSNDDTYDVALEQVRTDPRFRVARINNDGPSTARNHGYALTNPGSAFVTFMDSDDVWLPHALETLSRHLRGDPVAAGAHGLAEVINEEGEPIDIGSYAARGRNRLGLEGGRLVAWPLDRPTDFSVLVNGNVLFPPGLVLVRRTVYERAGRFDERFRGPEDWDMLIRLSRFGHIAFVNDVILHYRRHDSNLGAASGIEQQAWLVRCKAFHSPDNDPIQRRIARRGWRAYQRYMIRQRYRSGVAQVRGRHMSRSLNDLARIPVHAFRWLRGYPTPKLVRADGPWPVSVYAKTGDPARSAIQDLR